MAHTDLRHVHVECEMNDDEPFRLFTKLERGEKSVEVRVLIPPKGEEPRTKWWSLCPGEWDTAELTVVCAGDPSRRFTRPVQRSFMAFGYRALIDQVGHQRCVPGTLNTEDAIERVYKRFYPDKLEGYNVLGIELVPPK